MVRKMFFMLRLAPQWECPTKRDSLVIVKYVILIQAIRFKLDPEKTTPVDRPTSNNFNQKVITEASLSAFL